MRGLEVELRSWLAVRLKLLGIALADSGDAGHRVPMVAPTAPLANVS
jgi:hypothetical protein